MLPVSDKEVEEAVGLESSEEVSVVTFDEKEVDDVLSEVVSEVVLLTSVVESSVEVLGSELVSTVVSSVVSIVELVGSTGPVHNNSVSGFTFRRI